MNPPNMAVVHHFALTAYPGPYPTNAASSCDNALPPPQNASGEARYRVFIAVAGLLHGIDIDIAYI